MWNLWIIWEGLSNGKALRDGAWSPSWAWASFALLNEDGTWSQGVRRQIFTKIILQNSPAAAKEAPLCHPAQLSFGFICTIPSFPVQFGFGSPWWRMDTSTASWGAAGAVPELILGGNFCGTSWGETPGPPPQAAAQLWAQLSPKRAAVPNSTCKQ